MRVGMVGHRTGNSHNKEHFISCGHVSCSTWQLAADRCARVTRISRPSTPPTGQGLLRCAPNSGGIVTEGGGGLPLQKRESLQETLTSV